MNLEEKIMMFTYIVGKITIGATVMFIVACLN